MKSKVFFGALICAAAVGITGCASSDPGAANQQTAQKPAAPPKDDRPWDQRLKVGMTKDEVRQALGNPNSTGTVSTGEESWNYNDNIKHAIPFFTLAGGKTTNLIVNFDKDGKVKSWSSSSQGL